MSSKNSLFQQEIYFSFPLRSPIAKFGASYKKINAAKLAALCLGENRTRSNSLEELSLEGVILGHARQAGCGPNPARQAMIAAGIENTVTAWTLNQACASGMASLVDAAFRLNTVNTESYYWAGGVESMSNTPYMIPQARWGQKLGHLNVVDGMYQDGFHCPMADMPMGETVEKYIAKELGITRKVQDLYAYNSHNKASAAWKNGRMQKETFALQTGKAVVSKDEHLRENIKLEKLAQLAPVFDKEGTLSAGNSSGITDGSAFIAVHNSNKIAQATKSCQLIDAVCIGLDPKKMGLGPIMATQKLLKRNNLKTENIDLFEINEAFAAQAIACQKALDIPDSKLNISGGAIALGHPIGASGARICVTLMHDLFEQNKKGALGIATLCVSGGQGYSLLLKSV